MIGSHAPENRVWSGRSFVSLQHVLAETRTYRDAVEVMGLGPASRRALERWSFYPRLEGHGLAWRILADEAFVAFGNGLYGLEVPIFGSLLDRQDVRFVGGNRMTRALWATGSASSRSVTVPRTTVDLGQAGAALSVGEEAFYVLPSGSRCDRHVWERIGQIVGQLVGARTDGSSQVWLMPVVYRVSPIHVLASRVLPRRSVTRLLARVRAATWAGVPAVFMGDPLPVDDLGTLTGEPAVQRIGDLWASAVEEADRAIPRWSPFR